VLDKTHRRLSSFLQSAARSPHFPSLRPGLVLIISSFFTIMFNKIILVSFVLATIGASATPINVKVRSLETDGSAPAFHNSYVNDGLLRRRFFASLFQPKSKPVNLPEKLKTDWLKYGARNGVRPETLARAQESVNVDVKGKGKDPGNGGPSGPRRPED